MKYISKCNITKYRKVLRQNFGSTQTGEVHKKVICTLIT